MPVPDLPTELWLEIISYFPPSFIMKLMGINRILFELALNYKYEEFRFISADSRALHYFDQLKHENIVNRVRRLHLRPDFLPGPDEKWMPEDENDKFVTGCFSWLRKPQAPAGRLEELLQVASKALARCKNLQEVTIIIYDHKIISPFAAFLSSLWGTLGERLRKLCIQTTYGKVPMLLRSIANENEKLSSLSSFEFTIMPPRKPMAEDDAEKTTTAVLQFLETFNSTLTSFSLSSLLVFDLSPLFDRLEGLPALRKFELLFIMCDATLSKRISLVHFLSKHKQTLEHLVIDPRPRYEVFFPYASDLGNFFASEFTQVQLPNVKIFQIGNRILPPKLVPNIMPQLQHLVVRTGDGASEPDLRQILDNTSGALESLEIWIHEFSPEALNLLAKGCPNLRRLTVGYSRTSLNPPMQLPDGSWQTLYDPYSSRRYPRWPLHYLRLGIREDCKEIHPEEEMANAVAQTVPQPVEKDLERKCFCYVSLT